MKIKKSKDRIFEWYPTEKAKGYLSDVHYIDEEIEKLSKKFASYRDALVEYLDKMDEKPKVITDEGCKINILEIRLLNDSTYVKHFKDFSIIKDKWWLRGYDGVVSVVDEDGRTHSGFKYSDDTIGVRPVLRLVEHDGKLNVGNKVQIAGITWTIFDEKAGVVSALCDDVVAHRRYDKTAVSWCKAELKSWLEEWFEYLVMGLDNITYERKTE